MDKLNSAKDTSGQVETDIHIAISQTESIIAEFLSFDF